MGNWTPSIVPSGDSETVYLVPDDFGDLGRVWRETDFETAADLETIIRDLLKGEYANPVRSSASTPQKAGRAMSPKMSLKNCSGAATSSLRTGGS
jgi:hypothetical protein